MHAGLLILIMLAAVPAVIAQTQPQTVQQMRERQLQQLQQEAATLPEQKADSISDVLKISIEDNLLTAKSLISSDVSEMRIVAPKLRGVARIKWYPSPQQDTDRSGRFLLIIDNPNDPESGHVIATVSATGGRFVLARDSEADDRVDSVQYIQAPPAPPGTPYVESTVKLYVTHKGDADQSKQVDLKLAADTFTQLRAEHQAEVDRFLRPFLRDLGQEASVFGIPDNIAWQVLGTNYKPDPKTLEQVKTLVAQLGADDFRQRQAALASLKKMGQPAALTLLAMDRESLSLQQSNAVDSFLADTAPLDKVQSSAMGENPSALLDMLFTDDAALRQQVIERLSKVTGKTVSLDPSLSASDRAAAIARLRDGLLSPTAKPQ